MSELTSLPTGHDCNDFVTERLAKLEVRYLIYLEILFCFISSMNGIAMVSTYFAN